MRRSLRLAAPLLVTAATPALASGGFDCRATGGSRIGMSGTYGRVVGSPLVGAALHLGERSLETTARQPRVIVARSWLDAQRIWVDLADPSLSRFEAQLRAQIGPRGSGTGTLQRGRTTYRVRCTRD